MEGGGISTSAEHNSAEAQVAALSFRHDSPQFTTREPSTSTISFSSIVGVATSLSRCDHHHHALLRHCYTADHRSFICCRLLISGTRSDGGSGAAQGVRTAVECRRSSLAIVDFRRTALAGTTRGIRARRTATQTSSLSGSSLDRAGWSHFVSLSAAISPSRELTILGTIQWKGAGVFAQLTAQLNSSFLSSEPWLVPKTRSATLPTNWKISTSPSMEGRNSREGPDWTGLPVWTGVFLGPTH